MREKQKRILIFITKALAILAVVCLLSPVFASGTGLAWFGLLQVIIAPFEIFMLAVLWIVYATYPSISRMVAGKYHHANGSHARQQGSVKKGMTSRLAWLTFLLQILSALCILLFIFGVYLLVHFWQVGGPNEGVGRHIFDSTNLYKDMQVGLASISISAIFALIVMLAEKRLRPTSAKVVATNFFQRHTRSLAWLTIALIVAPSAFAPQYINNRDKWSYKEYATAERFIVAAIDDTSATNVQKSNHCHYGVPEQYLKARLYCTVEVAGFVPYKDDEHALLIAHNLEDKIRALGYAIIDDSGDPRQLLASFVLREAKQPFMQSSCEAYIENGEWMSQSNFGAYYAPEGNTIGVLFSCSRASRGEYFPVTNYP